MGPGAYMYSFWGHAAIRVVEPEKHRDVVYNFGSIDFSGNFFVRMLRGHVDAFVSVSPYARTVRTYTAEDRTFTRRVLNLSPDQARAISRSLARYVREDGGSYRYHHFLDNCSTRVADEIDRVLDGALSRQSRRKPSGRSFRDHALDTIRRQPLFYVAVDLVMTHAIDRQASVWDARFLPHRFVDLLDRVEVDGEPVVAATKDVYRSKSIAEDGRWTWPWIGVYVLFLAPLLGLILFLPRAGAVVWGVTAGLLGTGIFLIWAITNYDFTAKNWNLLVLPVTHFGFAVVAGSGRLLDRFHQPLRRYAGGHAGLLLLLGAGHLAGLVDQSIGPALLLSIPPSLLLAFRLQRKPLSRTT